MSQDFLKSLPDDLRALVIDGVVQMAEIQTNFNKQQDGIAPLTIISRTHEICAWLLKRRCLIANLGELY